MNIETNSNQDKLETIDSAKILLPVLHSPKSKTMGGFIMS